MAKKQQAYEDHAESVQRRRDTQGVPFGSDLDPAVFADQMRALRAGGGDVNGPGGTSTAERYLGRRIRDIELPGKAKRKPSLRRRTTTIEEYDSTR